MSVQYAVEHRGKLIAQLLFRLAVFVFVRVLQIQVKACAVARGQFVVERCVRPDVGAVLRALFLSERTVDQKLLNLSVERS